MLTLVTRRLGDIIVIRCAGRIVEGDESRALHDRVAGLGPDERNLVLNLSGVDFVDSGGLGLLVRLLGRVQNDGGGLKLCAPSARFAEILRVTKLQTVFDVHESEGDAIAAFYRAAKTSEAPDRLATDILCVSPSLDVIAYLHEVLRQAGYGAMTSDNLPDALMLLRATRPKLILVSADLDTPQNSPAADVFRHVCPECPVIELPSDFTHRDAGVAAGRLLEQVRSAM